MRQVEVVQFGQHVCGWGEGLCWDADASRLHFVDCMRNIVGSMALDMPDNFTSITTPSMPTKVLLCDKPGQFLVVLEDGVYGAREGHLNPATLIPMPDGSSGRFNDATIDPAGRIITGNLGLTANTDGAFWRWQKGASSRGDWATFATEKGNANGPCFSEDGKTLYFADTPTGNILQYAYDPTTGKADGESIFANTLELGGVPDGAAIDAEGHLWIAVYGAGLLARYTPEGQLDTTIALPARNPTDIVFCGSKLDRVIVTSAIEQPGDTGETNALAGAMFEITEAGVTGLAVGEATL